MSEKKLQLLKSILKSKARKILHESFPESSLIIELCDNVEDLDMYDFDQIDELKQNFRDNKYVCLIITDYYNRRVNTNLYIGKCVSEGQSKEQCLRNALRPEAVRKIETIRPFQGKRLHGVRKEP